ncbi:hypothetical protein [Hyphomonas sp.]|uniref:hypothetical protein n=1 Tax=Hyphomonas sp. TaxID=87 RepID=UPI00391DE53D
MVRAAYRPFLLAAAALTLGACQMFAPAGDVPPANLADTVTEPAPRPQEEAPPVVRITPECQGIYETRGWSAWINRMPGPGAVATIHVAGEVDTRSGGYSFDWQEGPLDRSAVPALRLRLVPIAPEGMATQAIVTHSLSWSAPLPAHGYSRVIIGCGEQMIAEIDDIPDVF